MTGQAHGRNLTRRTTGFAVLYGGLLGLALLKFGNPVILDRLVEAPSGFLELVFSAWPMAWGQLLLLVMVILALKVARFRVPEPRWLHGLLLVWFGWQFLSSTRSIDPQLSRITLVHFTTCIACFGLGLFALGGARSPVALAAGILPFFVWMAWTGFDQHYGGLDATEKLIRETPNWQQAYPPEYLERIAKKRIFATLVYPNALAGVVLLLLPVLTVAAWKLTERLTQASRALIVGILIYVSLACLYWSGSKSGWLIALFVLLVAVMHRPLPRKLKVALAVVLGVAGVAGFAVKFAPYFRKGATSVGARFSYWQAASATAMDRPIFGTGPGTFMRAYAKIKPPGAEMAKLVHNDYLEQASDSGFVGFLSYAGFWFGSMGLLYRRMVRHGSALEFAVWLGLLGWCAQGFAEFGLDIPALAWPAFTFLGWLWSQENTDAVALAGSRSEVRS